MVGKCICGICKKQVKYANYPIQCDACDKWFHGTCENLLYETWCKLGESNCNWYCSICLTKLFPFWSLNENELEHLFVDSNENLKELLDMCMVFENVQLDNTPFNYGADDENILSTENVNTHYLTHNQMSKLNKVINENVSFIHFNARSLVKNFENIERMLELNGVKFSAIGVSETWFSDTHNKEYYSLKGYDAYFTNRSDKKGGGTALYIRSDYSHECSDIGTYEVKNCFEVTTVKMNICANKVIYLSCVYKPPNTSIELFIEKYMEFLELYRGKSMYICGDFNIDLMKYKVHTDTSKFLDMLYSYNMYPLIVKPTRINDKSATLIDNIFTKERSFKPKSYILIDDTSDHLPVFSVLCDTRKLPQSNKRIKTRKFTEKNVSSLREKLSEIDWCILCDYSDVNECYEYFLNIFLNKLNECCPLQNVKTKNFVNKPWFTSGLINACKKNNYLYKTWLLRKNEHSLQRYKKYKNKLTQILRKAEKCITKIN